MQDNEGESDGIKADYLFSSDGIEALKKDFAARNIPLRLKESEIEAIGRMKNGETVRLQLEELEYFIEKIEGGKFNAYGPRQDENGGMIAKSEFGWMFLALGIFFLITGTYLIFVMLKGVESPQASSAAAAFFLALAYVAIVLRKEKEIGIDKPNGMLEYSEKGLLSEKTSRKYPLSQIAEVFYRGPTRRSGPWIRITFRDGSKIDCETLREYVPGQREFGGAKVEYKY